MKPFFEDAALLNLIPNPGFEGESETVPAFWSLSDAEKGYLALTEERAHTGETSMQVIDRDNYEYGHARSLAVPVDVDRASLFSTFLLGEPIPDAGIRVAEYSFTDYIGWSSVLLKSERPFSDGWVEFAIILHKLSPETTDVRLVVMPTARLRRLRGSVPVDDARFVALP